MADKFVLFVGDDDELIMSHSSLDNSELRHLAIDLSGKANLAAVFLLSPEDAASSMHNARNEGLKVGIYQDESRATGYLKSAVGLG